MRAPTMLRPLTSLWLLAAVLMEWACFQASADDGILCDRAANMDLCSQRLAQKRFLRFGRALTDDAFLRFGRQFYRIGRSYPYEDKRFLRFGRSDEEDVSDLLRAAIARAQADESYPLYRRRRSAELPTAGVQVAGDADSMTQAVAKRDGDEGSANGEKEKRFMRFGRDDGEKRFMRFGRGEDKRFMRFGRDQQQWEDEADKRFMRFGREPDEEFGDEDDTQADKRFMRFGREPDKRFMRFGRDPADENEYAAEEGEDKDKRFMRFGRDEEKDKRFMRFGKRFMRFGRDDKRFMRFGRDGQDSDEATSEDKRFMRFGKRFMRFGKQDKEEPAKSTKVAPSS